MASTSLCLAAIQGHTAVVRVLLDVGTQVGAQGRTGYVPLVPAGTNGAEGYPEMMDRLLDRGADIGAVMKRKTALVRAAGFGQERLVHHLLSRGATPLPKLWPPRVSTSNAVRTLAIRLSRSPGRKPGTRPNERAVFQRRSEQRVPTRSNFAVTKPPLSNFAGRRSRFKGTGQPACGAETRSVKHQGRVVSLVGICICQARG